MRHVFQRKGTFDFTSKCLACGLREGAATVDCPGFELPTDVADLVRERYVDFVAFGNVDRWVTLRYKAKARRIMERFLDES